MSARPFASSVGSLLQSLKREARAAHIPLGMAVGEREIAATIVREGVVVVMGIGRGSEATTRAEVGAAVRVGDGAADVEVARGAFIQGEALGRQGHAA